MSHEATLVSLAEQVAALLEAREPGKALALVGGLHAADLADLVLRLPLDDRRAVLAALPAHVVAPLFAAVDDADLPGFIEAIDPAELPSLLERTEDDVAADVIRSLEPAAAEDVLAALPRAEEVGELLEYESESAGGIMSHGFVALRQYLTVSRAIEQIRILRPSPERTYSIFVTDHRQRLQGTVALGDLIVAPPSTTLHDIMRRDVHSVTTNTDQEEVARVLQRYDLVAVPVVSETGELVGVTTVDDVIDVLQQEATEDMYRLAGLDEAESILSPVRRSVRARIPWLMVNLLTAFAAAAIVTPFEGTIAKVAALAVFMPIIAGHAGNTGTQVATLVVRGIALGEVSLRDFARIIKKELAFGLIHGALAGGLTAVLAIFVSANPWLCLVVFTALLLNIVIAGIVGAAIPLLLKRAGSDPALASSIWLTTFTDMLGFLMLLGFGALLVSKLQ